MDNVVSNSSVLLWKACTEGRGDVGGWGRDRNRVSSNGTSSSIVSKSGGVARGLVNGCVSDERVRLWWAKCVVSAVCAVDNLPYVSISDLVVAVVLRAYLVMCVSMVI